MYKLFVILIILVKEFGLALEDSSTSGNKSIEDGSRVLSRRKRYLIFPDGSSFQLVFCTQNHGYLQIGDIVWFGNTAALAWELPTDPKLFHFFKDNEKDFAQNRDGVSKLIYFLDQNGKVLSEVPYKRKPIVNPAFAKRSVDIRNTRKILHENQKRSHYDHLDTSSLEFHRMGRKSFYSQLEKFIKAIGWNGRECVLRMLCEFGKARAQGMFLEEILKVTFTLPAGKTQEQYDIVHRSLGSCDELYRCEEYNSINI